jgi:multiple sugar transport system ATP-binding protein
MTQVNIDNLAKDYGGIVAVDNISLNVADGELTVLVGPSGCGKTTTLRCIAGLEIPTSGKIKFDETEVTNESPQNRDTSFVFQNLALYPHMTAYDNIEFPLNATDEYTDEEKEEAVREIAEVTDCAEFLNSEVVELSGGQQQRVALARALVREPQVFLMDEPFSDLDELLKRSLREQVVRLQDELGITMIHVTHDQEEAMTMGDNIIVLNNGNIIQHGDPDTIFNEPNSLFVARFIGSPRINEFYCDLEWNGDAAHLTSDTISFTLEGEHASPLSGAKEDGITACVRPQHLLWSEETPDDGIAIPVMAEVIEKIGTEDVVHMRVRNSSTEVVAEVESGIIDKGQSGYLSFKPARLHLFDGQDDQAKRLN